MSSFKQLSKPDVSFTPYHANKQWDITYCPYPTSSGYLTIYNGTNLTGSFSSNDDPLTEEQYDRLVYSQINQLFYQKYTTPLNTSSLANSIYYESVSQQRPTHSYFIYNDSTRLVKNFPTGAMEGIRVLAINQDIYSSKILPNHFKLSSSAYNITDDGYGNLYDVNTHIGNIFYSHGLGVITNQDYQLMFPLPPIAKNDYGSFLTTDTKTISASLNDYARSGTLNTSSLALSGSISGPGYSWATGSKGTIILTTTTPGTYSVWYTIGADIAGSCATQLRSNKAKVTAVVIEPTTTSTTTTTTTAAPTTTTTTTTSTTTSTTTAAPTTTTTTTSTTTSTTTAAPTTTTTSTTTSTTTAEPTTTTTSTTTTTTTKAPNLFFEYQNTATGTGNQTWEVEYSTGSLFTNAETLTASNNVTAGAPTIVSKFSTGPLGVTGTTPTSFNVRVRKTSTANMAGVTTFSLAIDDGTGFSLLSGFSFNLTNNPIGTLAWTDITSNLSNPSILPGYKIRLQILETSNTN
jgi:hypothetical protein